VPRPTRVPDTSGRTTRQRLVDAAAEVFAETGWDSATVADIVERAGLTTGALYSHFSNKAALLVEVIAQMTSAQDVHMSALQTDTQPQPGMRDDVMTDAWGWVDPARADDRAVSLEAHVACRRDDEVRDRLGALDDARIGEVTALIERLQRDGIMDPAVDARALAVWFVLVPLGAAVLEASGVQLPPRPAWMSVVDRMLASVTVGSLGGLPPQDAAEPEVGSGGRQRRGRGRTG
jgi:AcrR family transcriptional regulator